METIKKNVYLAEKYRNDLVEEMIKITSEKPLVLLEIPENATEEELNKIAIDFETTNKLPVVEGFDEYGNPLVGVITKMEGNKLTILRFWNEYSEISDKDITVEEGNDLINYLYFDQLIKLAKFLIE